MTNNELWKAILASLELDVSKTVYQAFFSQIKIKNYQNKTLEISCPNPFTKERIEERYFGLLKKTIDQITKSTNQIILTAEKLSPKKEKEEKLGPLFSSIQDVFDPFGQPNLLAQTKSGLSSYYTFNNFVVGDSNRLAYAMAFSVADKPGISSNNPFFLYSDVGMGKTHLLQAIGNAILGKDSRKKVLYSTGENFTNEIVEAIRTRTTTEFRQKFRAVDVFLVDDVQFIAGRETTQKEFFHTFNALHQKQKQVVLTSDKPPKEIGLEDRMSSRFAGGIMADIQAPDLDMRRAILESKARLTGIELNNETKEALDLIARTIDTNIRELEGGFKQVFNFSQIEKVKITVELVQKVLAKYIPEKERSFSPHKIIKTVCTYFSISKKDLISPCRTKELVYPRHMAMFLLRNDANLPLETVASLLGRKDHTTVLHGAGKIKNFLKNDTKVKQDLTNLKRSL